MRIVNIFRFQWIFSLLVCQLVAASAYAKDPRLNYICTFEEILNAGEMLCSGGLSESDGLAHFSDTLTTRKVKGVNRYRVNSTISLPQLTCEGSGSVGGDSDSSTRLYLKNTKKAIRLSDHSGSGLYIKLLKPLGNTVAAVRYANRGSLLYSGCDSCRVAISGECVKVSEEAI